MLQRRQQMIVVAQWGNLNRWTYLHQVAVLFSLAERTNHGRVWPEPLLSISPCLIANPFVIIHHQTSSTTIVSPFITTFTTMYVYVWHAFFYYLQPPV